MRITNFICTFANILINEEPLDIPINHFMQNQVPVSISIIIPVYGVESYVRRCIESVISQDGADASIECIIVDDCGSDRSMDIVSQMVSGYSGHIRFIIIEHECNRGLSAARNTGMEKASGTFVLFLDSDDYLMPDSIQAFVTCLSQYPDADLVVGKGKDCRDGNCSLDGLHEPRLIENRGEFFQLLLSGKIYIQAWNKLTRRSIIQTHQLSFIEGVLFEDESWSYHLFSSVSSILLIPNPTYVYEYNENSIANTAFSPEKAEHSLRSLTTIVDDILDSPPTYQRYGKDLTIDYLLFLAHILMKAEDLYIRYPFPKQVSQDFVKVRRRFLSYSLRKGRMLILFFFWLLFFPFSSFLRWRIFRHHYDTLVRILCRFSRFTECLHKP